MKTQQAAIVSAVRTPLGSFNGVFSAVPATKLGSIVIAEALRRINLSPDRVEDVYMGCVLSAGLGQAPARQASIGAGIPHSVGAATVNKVCGSSLQTVIMASQAIALGEAKIIVAGGMENMTRAPYLLEKARQGYRLGHGELTDSLIKDGLWDVYNNFHMGHGGELCAEKYNLTRTEVDDFALESYRRAREAIATGTAMYSRIPQLKCRFREASLKLGSMSQKRSNALAKIIHWQTRIMRFLLRLISRESRSENGMTQWKMKSRVMMMPQ